VLVENGWISAKFWKKTLLETSATNPIRQSNLLPPSNSYTILKHMTVFCSAFTEG
jgi:hypothetical protein